MPESEIGADEAFYKCQKAAAAKWFGNFFIDIGVKKDG